MRQQHEITAFQDECIQRVRKLIQEIIGKQVNFEEVKGRKEIFYQGRINNVVIYIYSDEAGFMLNKNWIICEKPDYSSAEELMKDFLSRLRARLVKK